MTTKLNPEFNRLMKARRSAQAYNSAVRQGISTNPVSVPPQPNRYLPHTGDKERARHAGKKTLGPNASRALATSEGARD